jgi:hypothetical protein
MPMALKEPQKLIGLEGTRIFQAPDSGNLNMSRSRKTRFVCRRSR